MRDTQRLPRRGGLAGVAVVAGIIAGAAIPASAAPRIGPNQLFVGAVNGSAAATTFTVLCPGPIATGHPIGDTVSVSRILHDPPPRFGRTGQATAIDVVLTYASGTVVVEQPITQFTTYTTAKVPATLTTPCSGKGTVTFRPHNGGPGSQPTTVPVTFVNLGV